jgi:DNA-directed RNA polymerase specialized sigma24 family protein
MERPRDDGSITRCLRLIERGDRDAAQRLWDRYIRRLVGLARHCLRAAPRRAADEEDVALSVFDSFFRRARTGGFSRLEDRNDLWQVLFLLTVRKAADLANHERRRKRGGGLVLSLSELDPAGAGGLAGLEPTPDLAVQFAEECRRLLARLGDDRLRRVAVGKLEGYTNAEIAAELGCVEETVERKLKRIRHLWSRAASPTTGPAGGAPMPDDRESPEGASTAVSS